MLSYTTARFRRDRRLRHRNFLAEVLLLAYWPAETFHKSIITRYPYRLLFLQVFPGAHRFPFYDYIQTRPTHAFETQAERAFAPLTPLENDVRIQVPDAPPASELTIFVKHYAASLTHPLGVQGDPIPALKIILPVGALRVYNPAPQDLQQQFVLGSATYNLSPLYEWQWTRLYFHASGVTITQYSESNGAAVTTAVTTSWGMASPVTGWQYQARDDYSYGLFDPRHSDHLLGGIFSFYGNVSFTDFWRFFYDADRRSGGITHSANHLFISHPLIQTRIAFDAKSSSEGHTRQPQRVATSALTDTTRFSSAVTAPLRSVGNLLVDESVDLVVNLSVLLQGRAYTLTASEIDGFASANSLGQFSIGTAGELLTRQPLGIQGTIAPPVHVLAQITNPIILRSFGRLDVTVAPTAAGSSSQLLNGRVLFDTQLFATSVLGQSVSGVGSFTSLPGGEAHAMARQLINGKVEGQLWARFDSGVLSSLRGYGSVNVPHTSGSQTRVLVRGLERAATVPHALGVVFATASGAGQTFADAVSAFSTQIVVSSAGQASPQVEAMILFNITTSHFGQFPALGRPINKLLVDFFIG